MKLLRSLLTGLLVAMAALAALVSLAFLPIVQTWLGEMALARQPDLHGSVGSLSIGPTEVEIEDLHLEFGPKILTIPSLQARIRLSDWLPGRTVRVQSLIAKGWTLDLPRGSGSPDRTSAMGPGVVGGEPTTPVSGTTPSPPSAVDSLGRSAGPPAMPPGWLARIRLPRAVSLDGLDTAGEIRLGGGGTAGPEPIRIQVSAQGGGLSVQHEGSFSMEASAAGPGLPANLITARGRLSVAMLTAQTVARVEWTAELVAQGGALPGEVHDSVRLAVTRGDGDREHYALELAQGSRRIARFEGGFADGGGRLTGRWSADLRDSDLRPFAPDRPAPVFATAGQGGLAWDLAAGRVRVFGDLDGTASRWEAWQTWLRPLGSTRLGGHFDLTHEGHQLRIDTGTLELSGSGESQGLTAGLNLLQPVGLDESTGALSAAPPSVDWAEVSVTGLPLAGFSLLSDEWPVAQGVASSRLRLRRIPGGFALRTAVPATASGVTLQGSGRTLATGLGLEVTGTAESASDGWRILAEPLTIRRGGQPLARIAARVSRSAGSDAPAVASGTWNADLDAWAASPAGQGNPWIRGQSAAGDFTVNLGATTTVEGSLTVTGHASDRSLTTHLRAQVEADHGVTFRAPLVLKLGPASTDLSVDGSWVDDAGDGRLELSVTGQDVGIDQLRSLAAPFTALADTAPVSATAPRSPLPFWGSWVGRAAFALARLRTVDQVYTAVGGSLEFDHTVLRLKGGRGELPPHRPLSWDGTITFDGAAYALTAKAGVADVDAAALIPSRKDGEDALIEGHFSVARTLAGSGRNPTELLRSIRTTVQLKSSDGILRWFKTNVGDAITQASTPATDALGTVGATVGSFFGVKRGTLEAVRNPLSAQAEAVLEFSNQVAEFGYDSLAATAVEQPDGSFRVTTLELKAPAEQVTGSGTFGGRPGRPFSAQPLALDLHFAARGRVGELLVKGGLARPSPSAGDLRLLDQPVHFGGTLQELDSSQWHDLLAHAALTGTHAQRDQTRPPLSK